jgi:hypothetical protein
MAHRVRRKVRTAGKTRKSTRKRKTTTLVGRGGRKRRR